MVMKLQSILFKVPEKGCTIVCINVTVPELALLNHHLNRNSFAELCSCLGANILGVKLHCTDGIGVPSGHNFDASSMRSRTLIALAIYVQTLSCLLS